MMPISRRFLLLTGLPAILSACQSTLSPATMATDSKSVREPATTDAENPSSKNTEASTEIVVTKVNVSFADSILKSDKTFDLPRPEIEQIVLRSMGHELISNSSPQQTQAIANVTIKSVFIANPASAILVGASSSTITARTQLVDAVTGAELGRGMDVAGVAGFRPTIFGAAAIKPPKEEIEMAASSLATKTKVRIYGLENT